MDEGREVYVDAIGSDDQMDAEFVARLEGDEALFGADLVDSAARGHDGGDAAPFLVRGDRPELLMKGGAVDKVPRIGPAGVGLGQVDVFEDAAVHGALDEAGHDAAAKFIAVDAPSFQNGVGVGAQVDGGARVLS